jgi:uncharacterized membrane protein
MKSNTATVQKSSGRVGFLDEVRGFAILCMVIYHIMYDLDTIYGVNVPIFFEGWFDIIRDVFAGAFIFISGTVCRYSKNNLKRGVQCFFIGMIVTFVTAFVPGVYPVYFGILHCLGISMMLFGLLETAFDKLPAIIGMIFSVLLFFAAWNVKIGYIGVQNLFAVNLPTEAYNAGILFPLGFTQDGFVSSDYFPLLPWFFLFLAGAYFGVYVKANLMPRFFYTTRVKFLAVTGRYTIWIYVLHQPVAYVVLNLIFLHRLF